jgi:hypothetical protein
LASGANLTGADARWADFSHTTLTGANTFNLIQSDGRIAGLDLRTSNSLVVRNYSLSIAVDQYLNADATGALRLLFDRDPWGSTIYFAPGIPVALGGTLELKFAPEVNLASQLGRSIDLFDLTGVTPTGAFNVSSPFTWDLTILYTTGEVTLLGLGAGTAGDFNGDNFVTGADLANWRTSFGTAGGAAHMQGDVDVDGVDFLAWQRQFTSGPAVVPAADAVPEPATLVTVFVGMLAIYCRPRRKVS